MNRQKPIDTLVVDATLFVVFVAFAVIGAQYQPMARELPLPISIVGGLLVFALLLTELFPRVQQALPWVQRAGLTTIQTKGSSKHSKREGLSGREWSKVLRWICWLAALLVGMQTIGYLPASGGFIFLMTWLEGRLSWWKALASAVAACLFFYVVFNLFLSVSF
ncbi:tripartite tricarboxylate transporter TctB family protein [Alicyclobacillus tolerans]|uniref:tripartite tricarboxylate transporter TctB family protein n=1 Tax=Alicyclobacillus tolerans TaxID=90970 RepID=UPI001F488F92|nr:tripartite tricarboxylate transporter TctB family protein [Alicyclobacillus tolerans]MCF8563138.1 tripartite tricarboxylate transporter TctB family protein [Alicyclobacillus tolerans]